MYMAALVFRIAFLAILNISGLWVSEVAALPLDLNTIIIEIPPSIKGNNAFERAGSAVVFKGCSDRQGQKLASFLSNIPTLAFTAAAKSTTPLTFRYLGPYASWYDDYVQSRFSFSLSHLSTLADCQRHLQQGRSIHVPRTKASGHFMRRPQAKGWRL